MRGLIKSVIGFGFELETQRYDGVSKLDLVADAKLPEVHPKLEVDIDESVDGLEIRTVTRHTYDEVLELLKEAYSRPMLVDEFCGLHIHIDALMVPDKEHFRRMLHFVAAKLIDMIPKCCLPRFASISDNQYFPFTDAVTKYSFISFREELNTFEFRFYGNVGTLEEAVACLEHAAAVIEECLLQPEEEVPSLTSVEGRNCRHCFECMADALLPYTTSPA